MKSILFLMTFSTLSGVFLLQKSGPLKEGNLANMENKIITIEGVDLFLKAPTSYNFLCTSNSNGEVLSATMSEGGEMIVEYASYWYDGDHSGRIQGIYNRDKNLFQGVYNTNDGRFSGEINFSFNEKGEAQGTWDNGYGVINIPLKNK